MILLSAPAGAAPSELYPGLARKWRHYQSPNFELYSANSERESRVVLEKMELLRALFLDTFKLSVRLPQPVTIYYFDRTDDFNGYKPPHYRGGDAKFLGFCTSFPDRTVITLAPTRSNEKASEVIYHEYVHYLFRITEQNPAPWFNEGVAELFSTLEEDKGWLVLGNPVVGRVMDLKLGNMIPFDQLFGVRYDSTVFKNSRHSGMFYAQAWAFLHYCQFGVNNIPPEKMSLFLRVAGSPQIQEHSEDFQAVCQELLGLDYAGMESTLRRYITSGKYAGRKVRRPAIAAQETYLKRPAPSEEMAVRLAELALRMTGSPYANLLVRAELVRVPNSRLHELMGAVALQEDQTGVARDHFRQAMQLGTANAAVFRELSRIEADAVFGNFDLDYRMPDKRAAELRHLLHRSIECAPEQSMSYEILAWVEAMAGQPDIAAINRVQQRFNSLNDRARTLLALVIVRMRMGDKAAALQLLDGMETVRPTDEVRFCAELTRARLENRPVDRSRLPESSNRAGGIKMVAPRIALPH